MSAKDFAASSACAGDIRQRATVTAAASLPRRKVLENFFISEDIFPKTAEFIGDVND
jgi:hypothetical protein